MGSGLVKKINEARLFQMFTRAPGILMDFNTSSAKKQHFTRQKPSKEDVEKYRKNEDGV